MCSKDDILGNFGFRIEWLGLVSTFHVLTVFSSQREVQQSMVATLEAGWSQLCSSRVRTASGSVTASFPWVCAVRTWECLRSGHRLAGRLESTCFGAHLLRQTRGGIGAPFFLCEMGDSGMLPRGAQLPILSEHVTHVTNPLLLGPFSLLQVEKFPYRHRVSSRLFRQSRSYARSCDRFTRFRHEVHRLGSRGERLVLLPFCVWCMCPSLGRVPTMWMPELVRC